MVDEAILLEKLKAIEDKVDGLQDTEQLTELDIINLKNEIEKIKIGTTAYIPEDIEEKVRRLEKLAENADVFEQWKRAISEIDVLRKEIESAPVTISDSGIPRGFIESMEELKKMMSDLKMGTDPELIKRVEELETRIRSIKPVRIPENVQSFMEPVNEIKNQIESFSMEIENLKKSGTPQMPLPPILDDFEKIKSTVGLLEKDLRELKKGSSESITDEDLKMKIAALFSRIERRIGEKNLATLNEKIETIERHLSELSKESDATGLRALEKEVDSIFSKVDMNESKINTIFSDLNKKLSDINSQLKSTQAKKSSTNPLIQEIKKSLKGLEGRLGKLEATPKKGTKNDASSLKGEIDSLRKDLEKMVTKQEFIDFEQNLIPPKIPDSKEVEEAMKKGIALEKEIEKINKKSTHIEQFLKRKDDIDKLKDDIKNLLKGFEELKKTVPAAKNSLPGPPTGIPSKLLEKGMGRYSEDLEYFRKSLLKNEAELSKNVSDIRNRLAENEKRTENIMNELAKAMKSFQEGPLPPVSLSNDNSGRIVKEINNIRNELKTKINENSVKDFEDGVYRELETLNKIIRDSVKDSSEYSRRINIELSAIEEKMKNLESGHEKIKGVSSEGLLREIEILKAKQKWIEDNIEHFNLEPLHEKIADFERRLNMMKINSPLIIE